MKEQTVKRFAVFAAAAALSTWAIDMAATQVGLVVALKLPKMGASQAATQVKQDLETTGKK